MFDEAREKAILNFWYTLPSLCYVDLERESDFASEDGTPALSPQDKSCLKQQIYLLRMRLSHFVNGFHNFIMTMVGITDIYRSSIVFEELSSLSFFMHNFNCYFYPHAND